MNNNSIYMDQTLQKIKDIFFGWKKEKAVDRTSERWQKRHAVVTRHDLLNGHNDTIKRSRRSSSRSRSHPGSKSRSNSQ